MNPKRNSGEVPGTRILFDREAAMPLVGTKPVDFNDIQALREDAQMSLAKFERSSDEEVSIDDELLTVEQRELRVRTYRPRGSHHGGLLWIHGGAFTLGSPRIDDDICRHLALKHRRIVVSPDYRLSPEHIYPAAKEDCLAALSYLENILKESGQNQPIAIAGASAGGNLALETALAVASTSLNLERLILVYPVVDPSLNTESMRKYESAPIFTAAHNRVMWDRYLTENPENLKWHSPLSHPQLDTLPLTLVVTTEHDPLRDEGLELVRTLISAGVSVHGVHVAGSFHAFDRFAPDSGLARYFMAELDSFMSRELLSPVEVDT